MHGGRIVARWLKAQGVATAFTVCGEHILALLDGLAFEGIRVVGARHEQAAVLMAEGYARASGRPGVALVTAGPGLTNAVTGLATAAGAGTPVLLLAGRTSFRRRGQGTFQDVDQLAIVASLARWAGEARSAERVPEDLDAAWRAMRAGGSGPAYLEIPYDVLGAEGGEPALAPVGEPERPWAPDADVARAAEELGRAEKPVVIAGSGAFWSGAGPALAALAERARLPVVAINSARGLLPDDHACALGPLGHGSVAILQADAVLLIGTRLNVSLTFGGPPLFGEGARIVQIDLDPEAMKLNRPADLPLVGDARAVLEQLAATWGGQPKDAWLAECQANRASMAALFAANRAADGAPVHPGRVPYDAVDAAGPESVLVADGGDILTWSVTALPAYGPGRLITTHDSLGTIGVGLPYAIGARAAHPERPVVLVTGDGAFGFNVMEIETAVREGLPVVSVVANNAAWGNVRWEQHEVWQTHTATDLSPVRYDLVAEALGGRGWHVESAAQLRPAIEEAIASGAPAVVNAVTDREIVSEVTKVVRGMGLP